MVESRWGCWAGVCSVPQVEQHVSLVSWLRRSVLLVPGVCPFKALVHEAHPTRPD